MAAVLAWLGLFWSGPFVNDAAWQIWIGRQLNHGADLYIDILEVNPPLWFWGGALVAGAADAIGISGFDVLKLAFCLAALASIMLIRPLMPDPRERILVYGALVFVLALTSRSAFLQREQFTLIAALPYVVLAARQAERRTVSLPLSLVIGVFAAMGFALKHYFALVPLALFVWLTWQRGRFVVPPELWALAAAGLTYGVAIPLLTPEYLTTMLPMIRLAYSEFEADLVAQIANPGFAGCVAAFLGLIFSGRRRSAIADPALIAGCVFLLAYFLQAKAFFYHLVPALGMLGVAVAADLGARFAERRPSLRDVPALTGFLLLVFLSAVQTTQWSAEPDAASAVRGLPRGASVMMLTASGGSMWPLVEERGLVHPSRHMFFWMLRPIQTNPNNRRMRELADEVREQTADDLECTPPDLILVDTRDGVVPGDWLISFFEASPRLNAIMKRYRSGPRIGPYTSLRRDAVATRKCRAIIPAPSFSK